MVRRPKVFLFDEAVIRPRRPIAGAVANRDRQIAPPPGRHDDLRHPRPGRSHDAGQPHCGDERRRDSTSRRRDEHYHHPANMFVAGFIGSPPMNFFGGAIAQKDGGLFFVETGADGAAVADGLAARLPDNLAARMNDCVGRQIRFGLRPENITDQSNIPEATPGQTIEATVEIVEPRGAETYLHLSRGAQSFVARVHAAGSVPRRAKGSACFRNGPRAFLRSGFGPGHSLILKPKLPVMAAARRQQIIPGLAGLTPFAGWISVNRRGGGGLPSLPVNAASLPRFVHHPPRSTLAARMPPSLARKDACRHGSWPRCASNLGGRSSP